MKKFRHNHTRSAKWRYGVIGGIVVVLIGAGIIYYQWVNRPIVGRQIIHQADFAVYVPTAAPNGYSLQKDTAMVTGDTLTYAFVNAAGDATIAVTVQPRPASFNMKQMTEGGAVNSTTTANGVLYDLSAGGASKFLLDTGDSLVFITSAKTMTTVTINDFIASLRRYN